MAGLSHQLNLFVSKFLWDGCDLAYIPAVALPLMAGCLFGGFYAVKRFKCLCPHCRRVFKHDGHWTCLSCSFENNEDWWYCILNKCKACSTPPTVHKCPHCSENIYLDEELAAASKIDQESSEEAIRNRLREEKKKLEGEIETTKLLVALAEARKYLEQITTRPKKERDSIRSGIKRKFSKKRMAIETIHEFANAWKKDVLEKNLPPEELEAELDLVDNITSELRNENT